MINIRERDEDGQMIKQFVAWCGKISPTTEGEQLMIQYGAELLAENTARMSLLLLISFALGKGWECVVFLLIFGCLRIHAGGIHAETGWGCGLWMALLLAVAVLSGEAAPISELMMGWIFAAVSACVLWRAPATVNRDCYTAEGILQKKIDAILTLLVYYFFPLFLETMRNVAVCAVVLEAITMLPEIHNKN